MKWMIVAITADREHCYYYHGKDKNGVPIFYGYLNYKNTKVYPRIFSSFTQADDVIKTIESHLENSMYKSLHYEIWTDDNVEFRVNTINK